ncbi:MAG: hypothetical protein AAGC60_07045 [Acidobacteriota bacterium]
MHDEFVARMRAVLREHVERRSSGRRLSEAIGDAPNYVGRILRGEITLRVDRLDAMLCALGVQRRIFFEQVLGNAPLDLAALLELIAPPERRAPRALRAVDRVLDEGPETAASESSTPRAAGHDEELEALERLRLEDRGAARRRAESLIEELTTSVASSSASTDASARTVLARLAEVLAVWAAIARVEGRRDEAAGALRRADRLATLVGDPATRAAVDQKAAYLLRDLDEGPLALRLLERASDAFLRAGDRVGCGRSLVDRAVVQVHRGELDDAASLYDAALRWLPADEWRNRVSALQGLAYCRRELGDTAAARRALEDAHAEHGERSSLLLAWVLWAEADLLADDRLFDDALVAIDRAAALFAQHGDTLNRSLATLARVELLLRAGHLEALGDVADDLMQQLEAWRGDRIADAALWELLRLVRRGEATLEALEVARAALRHAASRSRR